MGFYLKALFTGMMPASPNAISPRRGSTGDDILGGCGGCVWQKPVIVLAQSVSCGSNGDLVGSYISASGLPNLKGTRLNV